MRVLQYYIGDTAFDLESKDESEGGLMLKTGRLRAITLKVSGVSAHPRGDEMWVREHRGAS